MVERHQRPGRMAGDLAESGTSEKGVVDKLSMLNHGLKLLRAMKFAALDPNAYCQRLL